MKKVVKIITVISMILIVLSISISYALSDNINQTFLTVNKQEISVGETLEISINLNQIEWSQAKFTLSSNFDISGIYSNNENQIEMEKETQDITFEIDKSKLDLEKIVLYYQIPKEIEVGTNLTLNGIIENLVQNDDTQGETIKTCNITVKIINNASDNSENSDNDTNRKPGENTDNEKEMENEPNSEKNKILTQTKQNNNEMTSNSLQSKNTNNNNNSMSSQAEKITYNGSGNNYLSSLSVNGYTLNKEFNKESSTYFLTVEEINSLEIIATAEDTVATVCISGADNLKEGENKILISVTAENGNVRNYRIYVTKG